MYRLLYYQCRYSQKRSNEFRCRSVVICRYWFLTITVYVDQLLLAPRSIVTPGCPWLSLAVPCGTRTRWGLQRADSLDTLDN
jgi:hypothetical protein